MAVVVSRDHRHEIGGCVLVIVSRSRLDPFAQDSRSRPHRRGVAPRSTMGATPAAREILEALWARPLGAVTAEDGNVIVDMARHEACSVREPRSCGCPARPLTNRASGQFGCERRTRPRDAPDATPAPPALRPAVLRAIRWPRVAGWRRRPDHVDDPLPVCSAAGRQPRGTERIHRRSRSKGDEKRRRRSPIRSQRCGDVDPLRLSTQLHHDAGCLEVGRRQAEFAESELRERVDDALRVGRISTYPDIEVLGVARMVMCGQGIAPDDQEPDIMIDERLQELLEVGVQFHGTTRDVRVGVPRPLRVARPRDASPSIARARRGRSTDASKPRVRPTSRRSVYDCVLTSRGHHTVRRLGASIRWSTWRCALAEVLAELHRAPVHLLPEGFDSVEAFLE